MGFGYGVDITAISELALKVYTAFEDSPGDYRNTSDQVKSFHIILNQAAQHFESTTLSNSRRQEGQEVLEGCQNVLEDLDSFILKFSSLASTSTSQVLQRVQLGAEDIATLRARLTSNTALLNGFIQSCDSDRMQAQLDNILGLHCTTSRDSLDFSAGSINTKQAYKKFCNDLFEMGVTADMISEKEKEIQEIFNPQHIATSNQMGGSTSGNHTPLPEPEVGGPSDAETLDIATLSIEDMPKPGPTFGWVRPPIDFLVGPLMLAAAEEGDTKRLISTFEYVWNINFADDDRDMTALHKAAASGHKDIVQFLLSKGALVESRDCTQNTPLHGAANSGHTSIVELLIAKGASTEARNRFYDTPLHSAAERGHTSTVELLLSKGASIETMGNYNDTALHNATRNDDTIMVELLLSKGAPTEITNEDGQTPLQMAARNGYTGLAELFLSKGASIEAMDPHNCTPLYLAAENGHTSTMELLLSKDASIEAITTSTSTPLHIAASNGHTSAVDLLLSKGASIEAMDMDTCTPLHLATVNGHTSTAELLLAMGARGASAQEATAAEPLPPGTRETYINGSESNESVRS